jgi:hypothetical protein
MQTYADLTSALGSWLQRSDITALFPSFIQLFEAAANRRLRVRQQETSAVLTPMLTLTVTGAADNGAGLVRLTTSGAQIPLGGTFLQGDQAVIAGVVGTVEANGTFNVTTPDGVHIDLLGSTFADPYMSGGTVMFTGRAALPADYLAWRQVTWLGNPVRELEFVHPSIMASRYPSRPIDLPSEFTIEGSTVRVMPRDATPLRLLYYQLVPSLAANTTNWLMSAFPDLYLFGALTEAQAYAVNADTAALWKSRRDELFDEVERLSNKSRGAGAVRVLSPTP